MKRRSTKKLKLKSVASARDATLRSFEERDLGGDIKAAGTAVV